MMASVLCLTLLAGCGGTSDGGAGEEIPAGEQAPAEETAAAADAEGEAEEANGESAGGSGALDDGVLNVGTNAEFPPFEYVDDNGEPDGFDIALIKAIGEKMGVEVQVENMEFDALVASIGRKIDVAIAGMTITEERQKMVDFSNPYYMAVQYVILPEGSTIAGAEDLQGKAIGVQLGTTGDILAEEIEGAEVAQYNKALDAVNDLVNGRLDCVIVDKNPALVFETKFEGKVTAVDGEQFGFETEEYAISLPKGDTELADKINAALQEMMEDGTFDALVEEYIEGGKN